MEAYWKYFPALVDFSNGKLVIQVKKSRFVHSTHAFSTGGQRMKPLHLHHIISKECTVSSRVPPP